MLSEIIQTQKATHYKFHLYDITEKTKPQYKYQSNGYCGLGVGEGNYS